MTEHEIKLLIESIVAANRGFSIETWGLIVAIVSAFGTLIYSFFTSFEKRLGEQNAQFKVTLDEQIKVHEKLNETLMALKATLEVTTWRTKALEDTCKNIQDDVTIIKDKQAAIDKIQVQNFMAVKGSIKKEIDDHTRRCRDGRD
jgi:hypothetical protein